MRFLRRPLTERVQRERDRMADKHDRNLREIRKQAADIWKKNESPKRARAKNTVHTSPESVMAIKSHPFGRVTLTKKDATKFQNQVTFGKPNRAALESVKQGVKLAQTLRDNNGRITLTIKRD